MFKLSEEVEQIFVGFVDELPRRFIEFPKLNAQRAKFVLYRQRKRQRRFMIVGLKILFADGCHVHAAQAVEPRQVDVKTHALKIRRRQLPVINDKAHGAIKFPQKIVEGLRRRTINFVVVKINKDVLNISVEHVENFSDQAAIDFGIICAKAQALVTVEIRQRQKINFRIADDRRRFAVHFDIVGQCGFIRKKILACLVGVFAKYFMKLRFGASLMSSRSVFPE